MRYTGCFGECTNLIISPVTRGVYDERVVGTFERRAARLQDAWRPGCEADFARRARSFRVEAIQAISPLPGTRRRISASGAATSRCGLRDPSWAMSCAACPQFIRVLVFFTSSCATWKNLWTLVKCFVVCGRCVRVWRLGLFTSVQHVLLSWSGADILARYLL